MSKLTLPESLSKYFGKYEYPLKFLQLNSKLKMGHKVINSWNLGHQYVNKNEKNQKENSYTRKHNYEIWVQGQKK